MVRVLDFEREDALRAPSAVGSPQDSCGTDGTEGETPCHEYAEESRKVFRRDRLRPHG